MLSGPVNRDFSTFPSIFKVRQFRLFVPADETTTILGKLL